MNCIRTGERCISQLCLRPGTCQLARSQPTTEPKYDIYLVLNGLLNGEEGVRAVPAGGGDDPVQADGWYYLLPGEADGHGPHKSRGAAEDAAEEVTCSPT